jgi:hypothetical protein
MNETIMIVFNLSRRHEIDNDLIQKIIGYNINTEKVFLECIKANKFYLETIPNIV